MLTSPMFRGQIPHKGLRASGYQFKDLGWLEELYTISNKLWIYRLLEQTANNIDALNDDHKKSDFLQVEAGQRALAVREFTKQRDRAVKEAHKAQAEHFKQEAEVVACATAYVAWRITEWTAIGALFVIFSPGFGLIACMG